MPGTGKHLRTVFCYSCLRSNIHDVKIGHFIIPQNEEISQDLRAVDIDLHTKWLNLLRILLTPI